jgi:hypothetical protein
MVRSGEVMYKAALAETKLYYPLLSFKKCKRELKNSNMRVLVNTVTNFWVP